MAPEFPGCRPIPLKREELSTCDDRFEYWDGDTETAWVVSEPTSATHEQPPQRLAGVCHVIAGVRGSPVECYGTMDLLLRNERGERWRIIQADQSIYLHPSRALLARVHHYESELAERDAAIAKHDTEIARRDARIEHLEAQVRLLLARRFAPSPDRDIRGQAWRSSPDGQLGLFNEAEAGTAHDAETAPGTEVAAHRRATPKRAPLPDALPRIDGEHPLPDHERTCPHHGVELERFGEVTSEQLDVIPATIRVLRHVRGKYRCPHCEGHLRTAPMPAQPLPKSLASPSPGLLAHKANSLEPYAYLRHVFTELPKAQSLPEVEALLPTRLDPDTLARYSPQGPVINPRQ